MSIVGIGVLGACQSVASAPTPTLATTEDVRAVLQVYTPIATAEIPLTPTVTPTDTATMTTTNTPVPPTPLPTETAIPSVTPTANPPTITSEPLTATPSDTPMPEATQDTTPTRLDHYVFDRPIERNDTLQDWVNRAYPYGGTQFGQYDVHLGADLVNPRFTPILAAGDGVVVYAGTDLEIAYGPSTDYYGNLVVIQHDIVSPEGLPVFTLYGHMQAIDVVTGQVVTVGEKIGTVGDSGIAIGPHLHFEVRVGDPTNYLNTRNPELWIKPYREFGTLAGQLTTQVIDWRGITIFVRSSTLSRETYTYGGERVNSDGAFGENFVLGDLPMGLYEVIVSDKNGRVYFKQEVTIENGKTTWLDIPLDR